MFHARYRLFILGELAKVFLLPAVTLAVASRLDLHGVITTQSSRWIWVGIYLCWLPIFWSLYIGVSRYITNRQAKKLGVQLAPLIEGKWPGNVDLVIRLADGMKNGYIGDIFDELLDEAGVNTARMSLLFSHRIVTRDHQAVKSILTTGFPNFGKGYLARLRSESFLGNGVFTSDGALWKFHRTMARPYFDRERISDYKTFHKYTEKIIHRLDCLSAADETVDVQDLFGRFSLDTAGEFLFGFSDFNSLEFPLPKFEERFEDSYYGFARALGEARENVMRRVRIGQHAWTILEFFKDSQSQPMSVIDSWLNPWIERALARKGCSIPENSCFLEHLISSTKDTQLIKDQLLNILMAARDTTAETLTFASYALCQHPNVMARLRRDILENLGPTTVPTYEDLKGLKYLRAVINEVLRLFPPIPINTRTSLGPCVVPTNDPKGPFFVPSSGTQIIFSIISYQRRKDLWGDDADEFDPERWLDKRVKLMATDPSKFMPFGAGPRICLGQQFAYNQVSFVLVRLLQKFDRFELHQPAQALPPDSWKSAKGRKGMEMFKPKSSITLYAEGGIWMKLKSATQSEILKQD